MRPLPPPRRHYLRGAVRVLLAVSLLVGGGILVAHRGTQVLGALDHPGRPVADTPLLASAIPPETTTTTTAPPALPLGVLGLPPQPSSPIPIPSSASAREPLVEIGTIEIPKIGLLHRVFHGVTLGSINHGPSHWPGTPWPGEVGNSVFAGHRVTYSHPFRHVDKLVEGDPVIFVVGGVRSVYEVTGHQIVTPDAVHIADPTPTPTATLYACHPPGSARYRYVVHLQMVSAGPT